MIAFIVNGFQGRRSLGVLMMINYFTYLLFCVMSEMEIMHPYGTGHGFGDIQRDLEQGWLRIYLSFSLYLPLIYTWHSTRLHQCQFLWNISSILFTFSTYIKMKTIPYVKITYDFHVAMSTSELDCQSCVVNRAEVGCVVCSVHRILTV